MEKRKMQKLASVLMNNGIPVNVRLQPTGNIGGIITMVDFEVGAIIQINGQKINLAQCSGIEIAL